MVSCSSAIWDAPWQAGKADEGETSFSEVIVIESLQFEC